MTATELANYGNALPSLSSPIAENGDKRALIAGSNNETDTRASVKFGLPALMSEPIDLDGIPVPRQDLNGMYNLLSKIVHFLMAGGKIPYMASESTAIGGYPAGAEVSYQGHSYKSLVDSNTALPTDNTKWRCIDYLELAGGTMTGPILSNYDGGKARIGCTSDGTTFKNLDLSSGGLMQFDGKNVVRSINSMEADANGNVVIALSAWPDYANKVSIPNPWTASGNGWILVRRGFYAGNVLVYIDGTLAWDSGVYDACYGAGMVPVAKGSVVSYTADGLEYIYFVPAKDSQ